MMYRGHYIDGIFFTSKADVDRHIENEPVEHYRKMVRYFTKNPSASLSQAVEEAAEDLIRKGFTWEQLDQMEIEEMAAC